MKAIPICAAILLAGTGHAAALDQDAHIPATETASRSHGIQAGPFLGSRNYEVVQPFCVGVTGSFECVKLQFSQNSVSAPGYGLGVTMVDAKSGPAIGPVLGSSTIARTDIPVSSLSSPGLVEAVCSSFAVMAGQALGILLTVPTGDTPTNTAGNDLVPLSIRGERSGYGFGEAYDIENGLTTLDTPGGQTRDCRRPISAQHARNTLTNVKILNVPAARPGRAEL